MVTILKKDITKLNRLAGPLILTNLLYVAIATIDLIMLGMLNPLNLAAGGLAISIFNQFRTMGTGMVTATGNLVSYAYGQDDNKRITALLKGSLAWATIVGAAFVGLMLLIKPVLMLLDTDANLVSQVGDYIVVVAVGIIPCLWFQSLRHFSVGLKTPGPLLFITVVSVVATIILNYGFIFGRFGLPELGFIGVAVATTIVLFLSFFLFLFFFLRHEKLSCYWTWNMWKQDKNAIRDLWSTGYPIAATYGSEAGFFTLLSVLVATLGVIELAAHTVVNQIVYIVFMVSAGISSASSIYMSEACAKEQFQNARRIGYMGLCIGMVAMGVFAMIYWIAPGEVLWIFLSAEKFNQSEVLGMASNLLFIAAFLQFFDAGQNIGIGMLRGVGDVKTAFKLSIVGYWLVGLICAWIFCVTLSLGIQGVWYGLMVGLAVTMLLQLMMFEKILTDTIYGQSSMA